MAKRKAKKSRMTTTTTTKTVRTVIGNPLRLGKQDKAVIRAFTERRAMDGHKLTTDGTRLDGLWMGGNDLANWYDGKIHLLDTGSRAGQTVQNAVRREAPKNDLYNGRGWNPRGKHIACGSEITPKECRQLQHVYESAKDRGYSAERAAKQAWGSLRHNPRDLPRGHHYKLEDYEGGRDHFFETKADALEWREDQRDPSKWDLYEFMYGKGDYYRRVKIPKGKNPRAKGNVDFDKAAELRSFIDGTTLGGDEEITKRRQEEDKWMRRLVLSRKQAGINYPVEEDAAWRRYGSIVDTAYYRYHKKGGAMVLNKPTLRQVAVDLTREVEAQVNSSRQTNPSPRATSLGRRIGGA